MVIDNGVFISFTTFGWPPCLEYRPWTLRRETKGQLAVGAPPKRVRCSAGRLVAAAAPGPSRQPPSRELTPATRDDRADKTSPGRQWLARPFDKGRAAESQWYDIALPSLPLFKLCQGVRAEPNRDKVGGGGLLTQFSEQLRWHGMAGSQKFNNPDHHKSIRCEHLSRVTPPRAYCRKCFSPPAILLLEDTLPFMHCYHESQQPGPCSARGAGIPQNLVEDTNYVVL